VAVLGKGEAKPPQNSISSGNRSLMDGVFQASLKSVYSLWRAKAVWSPGSLLTAFRSFLCWSTIKSMEFWVKETDSWSWNFRTNWTTSHGFNASSLCGKQGGMPSVMTSFTSSLKASTELNPLTIDRRISQTASRTSVHSFGFSASRIWLAKMPWSWMNLIF
jgi:hypothetical protein